jgi:hypothetical protein
MKLKELLAAVMLNRLKPRARKVKPFSGRLVWDSANGPAFRPRLLHDGEVVRDRSRYIAMPNMRVWRAELLELEKQSKAKA